MKGNSWSLIESEVLNLRSVAWGSRGGRRSWYSGLVKPKCFPLSSGFFAQCCWSVTGGVHTWNLTTMDVVSRPFNQVMDFLSFGCIKSLLYKHFIQQRCLNFYQDIWLNKKKSHKKRQETILKLWCVGSVTEILSSAQSAFRCTSSSFSHSTCSSILKLLLNRSFRRKQQRSGMDNFRYSQHLPDLFVNFMFNRFIH